ncbi:rod shape-determining protein [Pseudobdellovibrio exovorus]|uniref:Cell shape-determining protein MreB n=1 Tax=Pseudobdellovibrio exovorus JSS TaxID=1184267 RepID=M4VR64_9BACT|nr:rod shape-determining protein [Pseudobdellovibrio exovorus]AGH95664.1 rod shape-determining protein [Pseudobdellovibrio exovorus JSS]
MFNWLFGSSSGSADIYIDLGTANTLIAVKDKGIVLNEPSQVMVTENSLKRRKILGVGLEGVEISKNNPGHIITIKPIRDGVIADFDATRAMLKYFIGKVIKSHSLSRPSIVVSLPYGVTEVEKKSVIETCRSSGASKTYLIDEPMAAAIGAGLPIKEASGQMIIDIGGGTTEIAVIALADIVYCEALRLGGHKFDENIIRYIKETKNLVISETTAEFLKIELGTALPKKNITSCEIEGRDLDTGFTRKQVVTSEEVGQALSDSIQQIVHGILNALENTPPELVSDIIGNGITLAGGGALIKELPAKIEAEVRIPVRVVEYPLIAIAIGGEKVLSDPDLLDKIQLEV